MSEDALVPVKLLPNLTEADVHASLFKYAELTTRKPVTRSFLTVSAEPSTPQDQRALGLKSTEPVGVMAGIYFLDDGTPFEVGTMRIHYNTCDIIALIVWMVNRLFTSFQKPIIGPFQLLVFSCMSYLNLLS
ncbi:UTRA domain [Weissella viridescens]|uniref:UTRA domain n=1 Tax=Weissella viridescens TaxID=1629 RepID=A0A380NWS4_WEIVI|nr:UTRA domain [Weissella viridescens]